MYNTSDLLINPYHAKVSLLTTGHFYTSTTYRTIREQGTQDWLFIYTVNGSGRIVWPTGKQYTRPGSCILYAPGSWHDYGIGESCDQWEILWTHFQPRTLWHQLFTWIEIGSGIRTLYMDTPSRQQQIVQLLVQMHQFASGALPQGQQLAMNQLEQVLLWCDVANSEKTALSIDTRISSVMEYICQNLEKQLTIETLAEQSTLSSSRFSHLFKSQIGISPLNYLEIQRIQRARELLRRTSFSVSEISAMVGFSSPLYFSRRFSLIEGACPTVYRKN